MPRTIEALRDMCIESALEAHLILGDNPYDYKSNKYAGLHQNEVDEINDIFAQIRNKHARYNGWPME